MSDIRKTEFEIRLCTLLNSMSMEQYSDTPDFILAAYLLRCLEAFDAAVKRREDWYGREDLKPEKMVLESGDEE